MNRESIKQSYKYFTIIFIGLFSISHAQVDTVWTITFGGMGLDYATSVQQTTDGGYILIGCLYSFFTENTDIWLIKTNSNGDTIWTKTIGGSGDDFGTSVQQTMDEGFIISGYTEYRNIIGGNPEEVEALLIKTDNTGDTVWTKTFGGAGYDYFYSVQQTTDEGYIIIGSTTSFSFGYGDYNVYLIKTSSSGDTLWTRIFGGKSDEEGYSIQKTSDEGYIITGFTCSFSAYWCDLWLIKTNVDGDTIWTKTSFRDSSFQRAYFVQQTKDDGYIIVGNIKSFSNGAVDDILLIKTNSDGDTIWTRTFGGEYGDFGYAVQQTNDSGYIVICYTQVEYNDVDILLIKTNDDGRLLWTKIFGENGYNKYDVGCSIQQTTDEGFIIAGYTYSSGVGSSDILLIKTTPDVNTIENTNIYSRIDYFLSQNYPNPFNPSTTIEFDIPSSGFVSLKVYNIMGQEITTLVNEEMSQGNHKVEWKPENISSGLYFYKLETKGYSETKKLVLMK